MSTPLALIAHDLKNALGVLECELAAMIDDPTPVGAETAHQHLVDAISRIDLSPRSLSKQNSY